MPFGRCDAKPDLLGATGILLLFILECLLLNHGQDTRVSTKPRTSVSSTVRASEDTAVEWPEVNHFDEWETEDAGAHAQRKAERGFGCE